MCLRVEARGSSGDSGLVMKTGLAPIVDLQTETLIVGSFPGEESLRLGQYYANPRNQFWKLMEVATSLILSSIPYGDRLVKIRAQRIGLWDVYSRCVREGSLDVAISDAEVNDFVSLKRIAPSLKMVCFNGKKAGKHAALLDAAGYLTAVLPSSSPANCRRFEAKARSWKEALVL